MAGEEMIVRETTAPGRGIMTATLQGGTHTAIATIAGEAAVAVTVVAAAGVGARIAPETATERGIEIETGTEIEIEITAGASHTAELRTEVTKLDIEHNISAIINNNCAIFCVLLPCNISFPMLVCLIYCY